MRLTLLTLALATLATCEKDESLRAFLPEGSIWQLTELRGAPFDGQTTITFPEPGKIVGLAPCNSYGTSQSAPYPWFEAGLIEATEMACEALTQEQTFFTALTAATFAEVAGDTLILSDDTGLLLVFKSR